MKQLNSYLQSDCCALPIHIQRRWQTCARCKLSSFGKCQVKLFNLSFSVFNQLHLNWFEYIFSECLWIEHNAIQIKRCFLRADTKRKHTNGTREKVHTERKMIISSKKWIKQNVYDNCCAACRERERDCGARLSNIHANKLQDLSCHIVLTLPHTASQ